MRLVLPFVAAIAVMLTTCGVSSGTVSLSGEPGDTLGPAVWMLGDYDIRLSMEHAEAEECAGWYVGLAYEVFDAWHYVFGEEDAVYQHGDFVGTTESLSHKLHVDASIPDACGPWSVTFAPTAK